VGRDGHRTLRGLYRYFRYHADGKQRKIYLAVRLPSPREGKLSENRRTIRGRD